MVKIFANSEEYILRQQNNGLVSESIDMHFIDRTYTTMDQSTNDVKRVLLKWNRFTLEGALNVMLLLGYVSIMRKIEMKANLVLVD